MHTRPFVMLALLVSISGCAWTSYWESRQSRRDAEECEAFHGVEAAECADLRVQATRDYEGYEDEARIGWGCGANAPDQECPSQR